MNGKHIIYAATILMLAACAEEERLGMQNSGKERPSVTVTTREITDNTFSFNVKAAAPASQYAYVVLEGSGNDIPAPQDILFNEVSGAYESDVLDVTGTPETTVTVECSPTMSFQIFAAAITSTGLLSEVVGVDISTTDTSKPAIRQYTRNGNSVTIGFSEPVKRGSGKVMVRCMQEITGTLFELEYLTEDDIRFSDGNAVITCPRPQNGTANGAIFMLSYEADAFVDENGNGCEAYWARYDETTKSYTGVCWQDDKVNFSIPASYFRTYGSDRDWTQEGVALTIEFPFNIHDSGLTEPMQVVYSEIDGIKTLYVEDYEIESDQRTVNIILPKTPQGYFDVSIKEGTFHDDWGNESNAFSPDTENLRYSVALPSPVCGKYTIGYGDNLSFPVRFEEFDEDHVVIYANWFNILEGEDSNANPILRGKLNKARKTITFDGTFYSEGNFVGGAFGRGFYYYNESYMLAFWGSGKTGADPIIMTYDDEGHIAKTSAFEYALHSIATSVEAASYGKVENGTSLTFISEN